jgi:putative salt-induced outer membrane protein YdiY
MVFCKTIKIPRSLALTVATILLSGFSAIADELLMNDGSRLVGKIIKNDGNSTLYFSTTYAGVIKVKWAKVSEVISDEPIIMLLKNGKTLQITSSKNTQEGVVAATETGKTETFSLDETAYINPEPWRLGEGWNWTGRLNAVLKYERGNSDKDEYKTDFSMTFRWLDDRVKFRGDYNREKRNDKLTDDDWRLNGRYDHFVDKKLFYGGNIGLEHSPFSDLRMRTTIGPLIGYDFYESKSMNLDVALGPMYVNEDFYDASTDNYVRLGWQFNFDRFLITDRVQFYHRHNGLLKVEDTNNLVWDAWTGFRFPIYAGIVISTEVQVEYDGDAPKSIDDTDTTYNIKLGYQW